MYAQDASTALADHGRCAFRVHGQAESAKALRRGARRRARHAHERRLLRSAARGGVRRAALDKDDIWPRFVRCTASLHELCSRCLTGASSARRATSPRRSLDAYRAQSSLDPVTSPSSLDPSAVRSSASTSSSISSAASVVGMDWSPSARAPPSPSNCLPMRASVTASSPARTSCMQIAAVRRASSASTQRSPVFRAQLQPATRLRRQPIHREGLQDAQVPARLPRSLLQPASRAGVAAALLRVVPRAPPPLRSRALHPGRRLPPPRPCHRQRSPGSARCCLRRASGALPARRTDSRSAPSRVAINPTAARVLDVISPQGFAS